MEKLKSKQISLHAVKAGNTQSIPLVEEKWWWIFEVAAITDAAMDFANGFMDGFGNHKVVGVQKQIV
jgi:hypothetical protein